MELESLKPSPDHHVEDFVRENRIDDVKQALEENPNLLLQNKKLIKIARTSRMVETLLQLRKLKLLNIDSKMDETNVKSSVLDKESNTEDVRTDREIIVEAIKSTFATVLKRWPNVAIQVLDSQMSYKGWCNIHKSAKSASFFKTGHSLTGKLLWLKFQLTKVVTLVKVSHRKIGRQRHFTGKMRVITAVYRKNRGNFRRCTRKYRRFFHMSIEKVEKIHFFSPLHWQYQCAIDLETFHNLVKNSHREKHLSKRRRILSHGTRVKSKKKYMRKTFGTHAETRIKNFRLYKSQLLSSLVVRRYSFTLAELPHSKPHHTKINSKKYTGSSKTLVLCNRVISQIG